MSVEAGLPELTEKQSVAFNIIKDGGGSREIAERLGISQSGAHSNIAALKRKGYLDADGGIARAVATPGASSAKPKPAKRAPTATPDATSNGQGDAFELDEIIGTALDKQGEVLKLTISEIDNVRAAHDGRLAGIKSETEALLAERERHEASLDALAKRKADAIAALDALTPV